MSTFALSDHLDRNELNQMHYFVNKCSSSRSTEEGNRETEAGLSPTEPQEDGKC